jgi:hypothetical protein
MVTKNMKDVYQIAKDKIEVVKEKQMKKSTTEELDP